MAGEAREGGRGFLGPMKAFLKRRWFLVSFAVGLVACGCVDLQFTQTERDATTYLSIRKFGIWEGYLFLSYRPGEGTILAVNVGRPVHMAVHDFKFHHSPTWYRVGPKYGYFAPLWLPLSAVLGWIVIRELRCREKREKEGSHADPAK
jgi:hypothetical protein